MIPKILVFTAMVGVFLFSSTYSQSNEPAMFLCVDSMMYEKQSIGKEPQKLVYGYIDGKKTPCMSEYEFRVICSKSEFENDSSTRINKTGNRQSFINSIYHGEKNLAKADLRGLDLKGVDLSDANLSDAQLESADLRSANLKNANLTGANLENTYCKNTNFHGANLTSANLRGTIFHHANLLEVEGLTIENLSMAATLYQAQMEKPVLEIIQSNYSGKLKNPKGSWKHKIFSEENEIPLSERADPLNFK